ncbi:MAG: hypothetical protein ACP5KG_07985 [Myxococcota bacterium]
MRKLLVLSLLCLALIYGCSSSNDEKGNDVSDVSDTGAPFDASMDTGSSDTGITMLTEWNPNLVPSSNIAETRGYKVARAIIHAHSIYSHDACDNKPWFDPNDQNRECNDNWWTDSDCVPNEQCVDDLREALCADAIDAFFLTDHSSTFAHPDNFDTLYIQRDGDKWIEENGIHTGSEITCKNGNKTILMVGTENEIMPIGLTSHVEGDANARKSIYDSNDASAIKAFKEHGAIVCQNHSEQRDDRFLIESDIDCIEIYNFHVSILTGTGITTLIDYVNTPEKMPHPDLAFLGFYSVLREQLVKWYVTVEKRDVSPIIGTDIHRNAVPKIAGDGERLDSYRRFMRWFSNFLLVKDFKPSEFKSAIREGRLYVVAEGLGTPTGFDYYAETKDGIANSGSTIKLEDFKKFVINLPTIVGIENADKYIKARLFKIKDKGEIEILSPVLRAERSTIEISNGIDKGVYAVQILLTPMHLKYLCKRYASDYIKEFVWIYSNAIRIE